MFSTELGSAFEVAFGVDEHSAGALDKGLNHKGGDAVGVAFENFLKGLLTSPVAGALLGAEGAAVRVGRGGGEGGK